MKATLVSFFMLTGIAMWGAAVYSADAGSRGPVNGYGVVDAR